jgi:hypothetical protein
MDTKKVVKICFCFGLQYIGLTRIGTTRHSLLHYDPLQKKGGEMDRFVTVKEL